jgi:hypothetical protein
MGVADGKADEGKNGDDNAGDRVDGGFHGHSFPPI